MRLWLGCCLVLFAGCSGASEDKWTKDRPETKPAHGVVIYDGSPLADASVIFRPVDGTNAAVGRTDKDGKFTMMTFEDGDGAVVGAHNVAITCVKIEGPPPGANLDEVDPTVKEIPLIPLLYGDFAKSGLTADVTAEGPNEFQFELTKKK